MSSLTISILILAVSAIVAVVAVNIGQALGRRRRLAGSRALAADPGNAVAGSEADAASVAEAAAAPAAVPGNGTGNGTGRHAAVRGPRREPRLGEFSDPGDPEEPSFSTTGEEDGAGVTARTEAQRASLGAAAGTEGTPRTGPARPMSPAGAAGAEGEGASVPAAAGTLDRSVGLRQAVPPAAPLLSPICDCIVTLPLDNPVRGERLIALTQGIRRAGGKPILVDGVPVGASEEDAVALVPGSSYWALRIGVLLANRSGPLNAMEYSDFVSSVQSVADQLGALADTPDMADAIARARDLDATCAQLDAQIGLNVDLPEPLGPAQVNELAAALRLVERGGHRFAWLGPSGEVIFTMALGDSPQRLGFLLDVPRTAESLDAWAAMLDCAQKVAGHFGGRLVDDGGRPIQLESLGTISRQLMQRYESLEALGLAAGSPLALRVFN